MKRGKYQKYECIKIVTTKMQESSDYSLAVGQSPRSLAAGFPLYSICRSSIPLVQYLSEFDLSKRRLLGETSVADPDPTTVNFHKEDYSKS